MLKCVNYWENTFLFPYCPSKLAGKTFIFSPLLFCFLKVDMHEMLITLSWLSSTWFGIVQHLLCVFYHKNSSNSAHCVHIQVFCSFPLLLTLHGFVWPYKYPELCMYEIFVKPLAVCIGFMKISRSCCKTHDRHRW